MEQEFEVNEYQLVIEPHESLQKEVELIKRDFAEEFPLSTTSDKPRLTILRFSHYHSSENQLLSRFKKLSGILSSCKLELRDFGSQPSHTIFLKIVSRKHIDALTRQLKTEMQRFLKIDDDHKPFFIPDPQITIARNIPERQFENAWLKYRNTSFTGRFIAEEMKLMKRNKINQPYKYLLKIPLSGDHPRNKQFTLFDDEN
ncbi:2'-5' RNA ligase family protein [Pollutibacter soli]|uniref:2'-5' RNA ligase family protein n=1 Tax=Pollutibacter soli TaxID=3034157 RepID=UPI003013FDFD